MGREGTGCSLLYLKRLVFSTKGIKTSPMHFMHKDIVALVQSPSPAWLFATPWAAARQAPLSPEVGSCSCPLNGDTNYLILCRPLLLLLLIFPSIRVFSNGSARNNREPLKDLMSLGELRELVWTGRPGVLQFMGLQRVSHDWATELNWKDLSLELSWLDMHWGWITGGSLVGGLKERKPRSKETAWQLPWSRQTKAGVVLVEIQKQFQVCFRKQNG